jgi:hypothetical protein
LGRRCSHQRERKGTQDQAFHAAGRYHLAHAAAIPAVIARA